MKALAITAAALSLVLGGISLVMEFYRPRASAATSGPVTPAQAPAGNMLPPLTPNMFERVIGACDIVTIIDKFCFQDPTLAAGNYYERYSFDTFRMRNGKLLEHWDGTTLPTPAPATPRANQAGCGTPTPGASDVHDAGGRIQG